MNKSKAKELKERGNDLYKQGDLDRAMDLYFEAVKYDPEDVNIYGNMAQILINKSSFQEAREMLEMSLRIDPNYVKGYYRLGLVHNHLNKPDLALINFEKTLKLDPGNKAAQKQIQTMKSANLIDGDYSSNIQRLVDVNLNSNTKAAESKITKEASDQIRLNEVATGIKKVKIETQDVEMKESNEVEASSTFSKQAVPQVEMRPFLLPEQAPKTLYQFICVWNEIKCLQQRVEYLKLVGPDLLLRLLAKGVEPDLFSGLVTCLKEWADGKFALKILQGLTKVARFDTLTLFMNQKEKADLKSLLDIIQQSNAGLNNEIHLLKKKYCVV